MPPLTLKPTASNGATQTITLPTGGLDVMTVYVAIDASAAAGPVTANLTIEDQSGTVIAKQAQSGTVPSGATGSATWALRLSASAAASTGSGIQFDQNNVGDWLGIECLNTTLGGLTLQQDHAGGLVNLVSNANNSRIVLDANADNAIIQLNNNSPGGNGGGVQVSTDGNFDVGSGGVIDMTGKGASLISQGALNAAVVQSDGLCQVTSTGGDVIVSSGSSNNVQVNTTFGALEVNTAQISFFGNTPVAQQTATTLAQVIAALQNYGLLT